MTTTLAMLTPWFRIPPAEADPAFTANENVPPLPWSFVSSAGAPPADEAPTALGVGDFAVHRSLMLSGGQQHRPVSGLDKRHSRFSSRSRYEMEMEFGSSGLTRPTNRERAKMRETRNHAGTGMGK
jgi:hypothetical protein